MSSAGIMNPNFFVSKRVLLNWLEEFFAIRYSKVEEAATGAIHCQILDAIFPGKVPLHKVNFNATQEYQYVQNFKILQNLFNKENITKHIPVEKLVKAKYQDNLEMLQWMKHFFETRYTGQAYEGKARREEAMARYGKSKKFNTGKRRVKSSSTAEAKKTTTTTSSSTTTAVKENRNPRSSSTAADKKKKAAVAAKNRSKTAARTKTSTTTKSRKTTSSNNNNNNSSTSASSGSNTSQKEQNLRTQIVQLRLTVEGLEKERDFYYNKLREVEILCSDPNQPEQHKGVLSHILEILYREDDDFQQPAVASPSNMVEPTAKSTDAKDVTEPAEAIVAPVEAAPVVEPVAAVAPAPAEENDVAVEEAAEEEEEEVAVEVSAVEQETELVAVEEPVSEEVAIEVAVEAEAAPEEPPQEE
jgi:RP/EB family microtubule-associated protein